MEILLIQIVLLRVYELYWLLYRLLNIETIHFRQAYDQTKCKN